MNVWVGKEKEKKLEEMQKEKKLNREEKEKKLRDE